ncbi:MAG: amidase domain-containing protein [Clostridia bacterium]|nr:amidase domain-containing protein [Clostridia bacterium]
MSLPIPYRRTLSVSYAMRWALSRSPRYYDFSELGGDCTNFVSQCLYAGGGVMNFTPDTGWYYLGLNNRAPAWTGARFLQEFLTTNRGPGPVALEMPLEELWLGDVIFLTRDEVAYHSLLVTGFEGRMPLVSTHSADVLNVPLTNYPVAVARGFHILHFQF